MQIEFWVEVYFETRRFRPLSSSPLPYTVFAPTLFQPLQVEFAPRLNKVQISWFVCDANRGKIPHSSTLL